MNDAYFSNGDKILELQANDVEYGFENDIALFKHTFEHIIALHTRERWEDLDIFPRDLFHRILKNELIQQVNNNCTMPVPIVKLNKSKKHQNRQNGESGEYEEYCEETKTIECRLDSQRNIKEIELLQSIPQFVELAHCYQQALVNLLKEASYNVYPHYHILKSKKTDGGDKFKQVLKVLDSKNGILVVAYAPYTIDSITGEKRFDHWEKYVIASGYRFWRSDTQEERELKFKLLQKKLRSMELKHDREFQKICDIKRHVPETFVNPS